jgi:hypothetical protein
MKKSSVTHRHSASALVFKVCPRGLRISPFETLFTMLAMTLAGFCEFVEGTQ